MLRLRAAKVITEFTNVVSALLLIAQPRSMRELASKTTHA